MAMPGKHNMRSKKHMIVNSAMMSDMIAAPENNIVANSGKRLEGIIFKNKTIFPNGVSKNSRLR